MTRYLCLLLGQDWQRGRGVVGVVWSMGWRWWGKGGGGCNRGMVVWGLKWWWGRGRGGGERGG